MTRSLAWRVDAIPRRIRLRSPHQVARAGRSGSSLIVVFLPLGEQARRTRPSDETSSFLPKSAESTEVNELLNGPLRERADGQRPDRLPARGRAHGGGQAQDRAPTRARAQAELPLIGKPVVPVRAGRRPRARLAGRRRRLHGRDAAATTSTSSATGARSCATSPATAAAASRSGSPATPASTPTSRRSSDRSTRTLLLATVLLVLVLLGAIYRSPLIAVMPLVVVFAAYSVAQGLIYLYAKSGATVSSNSTHDPGRADVRPRAPTTACCCSRATGRSCGATRTSTRRWRARSAVRARRSSRAA